MPSLSPMHLSFPFLSQFKSPFTYITCFHIAIGMIAHQAYTLALMWCKSFFSTHQEHINNASHKIERDFKWPSYLGLYTKF